jgi:DNA polymerase-3 subunit epsilon
MKRDLNEQKYGTIRLEYLHNMQSVDLSNIVGIFKSMKQAKEFLWNIAKGYTLCPRILGIEKGRGGCSFTQLQKCNGACNGSEPASSYNMRFNLAFAGRRMAPWPFNGPILIEEKNGSGNEGEFFIVDNWCLVGCFRFDETGSKQCLLEGGDTFDYDGYKILRDYLLKSRKKINVRPLTVNEFARLLEE